MKNEKQVSRPALFLLIFITLVIACLVGGYILVVHFFPVRYEEEIKTASEKYGLDPAFVMAVIDTESGFEPSAESNAGARGLMQIMPDTGAWIAEKLDIDDFEEDDLYNPETSIRLGVWYLDYLENRFTLNETVAASYNAGQGKVSEWLDDPDYSDDGVKLKKIPYEETENYVAKVMRAYWIYKNIYRIS